MPVTHGRGAPPTSRDNSSSGNYTGWKRRDTRGTSASGYEGRDATWGGAKDYENENEDGKDKDVRRGKEREVEKEEETEKEKEKGKGNDKLREKFINVTKDDLWVLGRVLSNKKGSLSATFEKNSEANNKVYDLNENTMWALDRLEATYLSFEGTWAKMEHEIAEGDVLFAASQEVLDELAKAQPYKDCPRDELKTPVIVTTWPSWL